MVCLLLMRVSYGRPHRDTIRATDFANCIESLDIRIVVNSLQYFAAFTSAATENGQPVIDEAAAGGAGAGAGVGAGAGGAHTHAGGGMAKLAHSGSKDIASADTTDGHLAAEAGGGSCARPRGHAARHWNRRGASHARTAAADSGLPTHRGDDRGD